MRKSALVGLGAAALMGGGMFIPAFATTPPPPTYTSPCGSSQSTGTAPATPQVNQSSNGVELIGQNGYLGASGSTSGTPSGQISGVLVDNSGNQVVYGSLSNGGVCVGSGEPGGSTVTVPLP